MPHQPHPTAKLDERSARREVDELLAHASHYSAGREFAELMRFVARFRRYSPFNAMLAHIQKPGARFVAPAHRWARDYRRRVKPAARPIVLLQPRGPVIFAFDVSDTESLADAKPLPREVEYPFEVRGGKVGKELCWTMENAKRDGIRVEERDAGSQGAGQIAVAAPGAVVLFPDKLRPKPTYAEFPVRYDVLLNHKHSPEAKYSTLVHELAHLYCGHLGTPNDEPWWPDRCGVPHRVAECEAESVAFVVCRRIGIDTPSEEYLSQYVTSDARIPDISLDRVLNVAGLIEQMGRGQMRVRKYS